MPDIKWVKLSTDLLDDDKILFIEGLPEGETVFNIWIKLILLAGRSNASGYLFVAQGIPYNEETLANRLKKPQNLVHLALASFMKLGMIGYDNGIIYLSNFNKHQNVEGLEKIREKTRLRVQKFRQNHSLLLPQPCNVTVTDKNDVTLPETLPVTNSNVTEKNPTPVTLHETLQVTLSNAPRYKNISVSKDTDKNSQEIIKLNDLKESLSKTDSIKGKVAFLGNIFKQLHLSAKDEHDGCYGRIGNMCKEYSYDFDFVLTAIYKTQDGMTQIDGKHLNYIEGILRKNNGSHGNSEGKQEPVTSRYEYVN